MKILLRNRIIIFSCFLLLLSCNDSNQEEKLGDEIQSYEELSLEIKESITKLNSLDDSTMTLYQKDSILSFSKYLLDIVYHKNKIEYFEEKADTFALTLALGNATKIKFYHDKTRRLYPIYEPFYMSSLSKLIKLYDDDLEKLNDIKINLPYWKSRSANFLLKQAILKHGGTWDRPEQRYRGEPFDTSVFLSAEAEKSSK